MTLASLERIILAELQVAINDFTLKKKNIMEWSTGYSITPHDGETVTRTKSGYYVAWKKAEKRP